MHGIQKLLLAPGSCWDRRGGGDGAVFLSPAFLGVAGLMAAIGWSELESNINDWLAAMYYSISKNNEDGEKKKSNPN